MRIIELVERLKADAETTNGELRISMKNVEKHLRAHLESTFFSHHDYTGGE